ncbi:MAG: L-ribulose-5-phosphate 4-epimerase AraD [Opitutales bacterium]
MNHAAIREACCEANLALPRTGLVDLTFGNVSVLDPPAGVFAIKPSGVAYGELTPKDMVIVDLEGKVVDGSLKPSSDTPTHCVLFEAFGSSGTTAVVHTHSRAAVAFAQAGRPLPCLGTTHADHFDGPVPCTRWLTPEEVAGDYEGETGRVIVETFETQEVDPVRCPAVLVQGHGPFCWGVNAARALENAMALEICADLALKTLTLQADLQDLPDALLRKHFDRKHGPAAYYGQG